MMKSITGDRKEDLIIKSKKVSNCLDEHYKLFSRIQVKLKQSADYLKYSYAFAFLRDYMQQIVMQFLLKWDKPFLNDSSALINKYFAGNSIECINKLNDDISNVKNIITRFYLSYVANYSILCQFSPNDEEFADVVYSTFIEIDNSTLNRSTNLQKLNNEQIVDLYDILDDLNL